MKIGLIRTQQHIEFEGVHTRAQLSDFLSRQRRLRDNQRCQDIGPGHEQMLLRSLNALFAQCLGGQAKQPARFRDVVGIEPA